MSTLFSVKDAAKKLNLTPQQVRNLCRDEKINASRAGKTWVLYEDDVQNYYDTSSCGVADNQVRYVAKLEIKASQKPKALSFFSGAMGLDLGLEQAGFNILLASEIDNACRKTILKNKPDIALIGDIRNYSSTEIKKYAGLNENDDVDLIVGGPPCQAFSTAGKRKAFEDERGNVFLNYIKIITDLRPKFAVIENVRGLLSTPLKHRPHNLRGEDFSQLSKDEENGGALNHILEELKRAGYAISFNLYNAANFGTPQKRERVIIICSRDGKKPPYLVPTHSEIGENGLPKWKTFRQATASLKKIKHHFIEFPEKRLRYYRILKPGQNWRNLPIELQPEALGASFFAGGGKTGFLRRLAWDEPSPTLVTHPAMPATDLAHPVEDRPLSVEEYKNIQEFPEDWIIEGSMIEQNKQIGNAVPVSLGKAVGDLIIKLLRGEEVLQLKNFPYSRYANTDENNWQKNYLRRVTANKTKELELEFI